MAQLGQQVLGAGQRVDGSIGDQLSQERLQA